MGDENFTLFILLGAYANQRRLDGLLMKCSIWASDRNVARQMVLKKDSGVSFFIIFYIFWFILFIDGLPFD